MDWNLMWPTWIVIGHSRFINEVIPVLAKRLMSLYFLGDFLGDFLVLACLGFSLENPILALELARTSMHMRTMHIRERKILKECIG